MFQTLVNVRPRVPAIWREILQEHYTPQLRKDCMRLVEQKIVAAYYAITSQVTEFRDLKTLYRPYFKEIKEELQLDFDAGAAARSFLFGHGFSRPFADTGLFFGQWNGRAPLCLVSDTDDDMIQPLLRKYSFDAVFTSESMRSYKGDPRGMIFKAVLEHYGLAPERVLHVGDSISDIQGAKSLGIRACWINRQRGQWRYAVKPDFVIRKLTDLL
jgi:putative hydrolase of the HAD superfamily